MLLPLLLLLLLLSLLPMQLLFLFLFLLFLFLFLLVVVLVRLLWFFWCPRPIPCCRRAWYSSTLSWLNRAGFVATRPAMTLFMACATTCAVTA
jgi:hypothetical protein